jgi:hypothetical protein
MMNCQPQWHYKPYEREQPVIDRLAYADAEIDAKAARRGAYGPMQNLSRHGSSDTSQRLRLTAKTSTGNSLNFTM